MTLETKQIPVQKKQPPPGYLNVITVHDLNNLREALGRGQVPPDFEAKLIRLASGDLKERSIEQNCRNMIALLPAAWDGSFKAASSDDCERLLKALAYVRKDEDLIADYRSDGFNDDQQVTRAATREFDSLLEEFKSWRLRHQVPAMWRR